MVILHDKEGGVVVSRGWGALNSFLLLLHRNAELLLIDNIFYDTRFLNLFDSLKEHMLFPR